MNKQLLLLLIMFLPFMASANITAANQTKTFEVESPNKKLSPYTGMSRDHWKQGPYMSNGQ